MGAMYTGDSALLLASPPLLNALKGKVQLVFTSPPFPLNSKKRYGNLSGLAYLKWLASFAPILKELLTPTGSIVMEVGNAWEPGHPVMSALPLESLLSFREAGGLKICQQFIWHNPARLPSPAQWVNVERIRLKDTFTHIWWMSGTARPQADNRKILRAYSPSMRSLLTTRSYSSAPRPSGHNIGKKSFLRDNKGAIESNVLVYSNTHSSNEPYLKYCGVLGLRAHPARMPRQLPELFIKFLTEPGELVLDPFAGSNTTGAVAEGLERRWVSIEREPEYVAGSRGRFDSTR
jgi:DNA modification methylase